MRLSFSQLKMIFRTLPVCWLTLSFFGYAMMSFIQSPRSFKLVALIASLVWPLTGLLAETRAVIVLACLLGLWIWNLLFCLITIPKNAEITFWVGGWALVVIWGLIQAGSALSKSFIQPHVFLILATTSWLGLQFGWLVAQIVMLLQLIV